MRRFGVAVGALGIVALCGCDSLLGFNSNHEGTPSAQAAGASGSAGAGGSSGAAGESGSAGNGGMGAAAGSAGSAGASGAGASAGMSGSGGMAGSSGSAGAGGMAGSSGSAGAGGMAGSSGAAGTSGAGGMPMPIPTPPFGTVAAGALHSCAISNGKAKCWGAPDNGRLGLGNLNNVGTSNTPADVAPVQITGATIVSITAGAKHTCALTSTGKGYCWGYGGFGQLGTGEVDPIGETGPPDPDGELGFTTPIIAISAGLNHTCVVLMGGAISCFGLGASGQLGHGLATSLGDKVKVNDSHTVVLPAGEKAVDVAAGHNFSCALMESGRVICWGAASFGQSGRGNKEVIGNNETLANLSNILPADRRATQLSAGANHACAVLDDGGLICWGAGEQLAHAQDGSSNVGDKEPLSGSHIKLFPTAVKQVSAGEYHTCVVLVNGNVHCFGANGWGRLGKPSLTGMHVNAESVKNTPIKLGAKAVEVVAGGTHNCARTESGKVRCWGANAQGQLGYGNTINYGATIEPEVAGDVKLEAGQ